MAILSEVGLGLIYAGATPLALTSTIEQTGAAELTVSAGSLTLTDGQQFSYPDTAVEFADGSSTLVFGLDAENVPGFYAASGPFGVPDHTPLQIVAGFGSGINVENGAIVGDVYVLTVMPGSPDLVAEGEPDA